MLGFTFFFSSRRRHTRSLRDWSSDVCSSDLCEACRSNLRKAFRICGGDCFAPAFALRASADSEPDVARGASVGGRSEERRVGKECRSGGSPDREKKNSNSRIAWPLLKRTTHR